MRVRHLRMVIFVALLLVIGGWGLLTPSQGQQQQDPNCPQAGCPEKPKDSPPQGKRWVMVIVHAGVGKATPLCDPDKNPAADAEIIFQDPQTKNRLVPGSQQPNNGLTDAKGRYAAYLALPAADWEHVEIQVKKFGFKLTGIKKMIESRILAETRLIATVCLEADPKNPGQLELQLWPGPGVPQPASQPLIGQSKTNVGSWMCVNLDNDDRDANFDLKQQNVNREDDLVQLIIEKLAGAPANATVQLRANKGANNIKLWDSPTKNNQVNLPAQFNMNNLPQTLWIEGTKGSTAPRDVELELVPAGGWGAQAPKGDKVALTVIAVEKLEWIGQGNSVKGDNMLDNNAHPGPSGTVGKRVFPDAPGPGQPARDKVTLRVTLSAPVPSEFKLYLRSLDVDDPSSNSAELDPNDTATAAGSYPNTSISYTLHEDNRGSTVLKSGQFVARAPDVEVPANALTDPQGVQYLPATLIFKPNNKVNDVDFQVTKQPGDNFRVLASCDAKFLQDAVNLDKDHGLDIYNAPAKQPVSWQSEVLTVWRRLHIERDSMQAPPNRPQQACPGGLVVNMNTVCGTITNVMAGAPNSTVTTDQSLEDADQYENGLLRLGPPPARQFNTLGNTAGTNATVTVQNDAQGAPPVNQPFDLHDDDDDAVLPRLPDLGWMQDSDNPQQNLFVWAYIRTTDDGGGGKTGEQNFPFDVNTEDDNEALNESYYTKRQSTNSNSNDYWVVYLLSVFQGPVFRDGDPNNQPARLGVCSFVGQAPGALCGNVLLFYVEAYRDACGGLNAQAGVRSGLQATVVHEVGHSFGADLFHTEGGIMASGVEACLKSNPRFTEITLNRIRSARRPGGGAF